MTMSMPITDASTNTWAFLEIIGRVELGEIEELLSQGMSPDLINKLRNLPTGEIMKLASIMSSNCPVFQILIDMPALDLALKKLSCVNENSELLEYFIRGGATPTMVQQLFNVPTSLLDEYRKTLSAPVTTGRPSMPGIPVRDRIHESWSKLASVTDIRHRYVRLHKQFSDLSLSTLHAVINEFG